MIRNEAPESMEGNYTVFVEGKNVTVTNMKTKEVATARCHPDDKFDLGIGVNEAIKKMDRIKVGDKVRIANPGRGAAEFVELFNNNPEIPSEYAVRYRYGCVPTTGAIGKVVYIIKDCWCLVEVPNEYYQGNIAYCSLKCTPIYIMSYHGGLEKVVG